MHHFNFSVWYTGTQTSNQSKQTQILIPISHWSQFPSKHILSCPEYHKVRIIRILTFFSKQFRALGERYLKKKKARLNWLLFRIEIGIRRKSEFHPFAVEWWLTLHNVLFCFLCFLIWLWMSQETNCPSVIPGDYSVVNSVLFQLFSEVFAL